MPELVLMLILLLKLNDLFLHRLGAIHGFRSTHFTLAMFAQPYFCLDIPCTTNASCIKPPKTDSIGCMRTVWT